MKLCYSDNFCKLYNGNMLDMVESGHIKPMSIGGGFPLSGSGNDSASRYFYCAKASKKDRDEGLNFFDTKVDCDRNPDCYSADVPFNRSSNARKNVHPAVKPTSLMQYIIRLVAPKGATILDPFMGSGSTGKACVFENRERNADYKFIGIELTDDYLPIAEARIKWSEGFKIDEHKESPQNTVGKNIEKSQKPDEKVFEKWVFDI